MKHNEAILRSPKWLRNFVDYEINTGRDIKGEPSIKRQKQIKLENWDKKWREVSEEDLASFMYKTYQIEITQGMLPAIKRQFRGDDNFWKMFDDYITKRDRIIKDIYDIIENMEKDFALASYSDKMKTPTVNGRTAFHYTFEDGSQIKLEGDKLYTKKLIYTLREQDRSKFVSIANILLKKGKARPANSKNSYDSRSKTSYDDYGYKSSDNPKLETYKTLKKSIELRKQQMAKMKPGPDKTALENELKAAESMAAKMKAKYQFENLKSFGDFTKIIV